MCADPSDEPHEQVRRLLAFLEPVVRLPTQAERLKAYKDTWVRLNPAAEEEVWQADMAVNYPWSSGKVDLWRTLRLDMESKFHKALNEHLNGEFTYRPIVPFSFMHYSEMLFKLLDIYYTGLARYIGIQDHISAVSANMDAYGEDERPMSEKVMRSVRDKRAQEFLDVILFMHAVPQRVDGRWDALDHESDVSWFREHCAVYQENEELMAFLRDCAVVVLLVGHFHAAPGVLSMHECYVQLAKEQKEELEFHERNCDSEKCFC